MKKFKVVGKYYGAAEATVRATSLKDALVKLENADEDELELTEPSKFEYRDSDVKETP